MKKISIRATLAAVLSISLLTSSPLAFANLLTATSPTSGAVLSSAPNAVSVTGTAPLSDQGNTLSVTDPSGLRVDDGSLTITDATAVIGLKPLIAAGVYTVTYTLISGSDVPLNGSYTFLFNAPATLSSPSPTPTQSVPSAPANKVNHTADIFVIIMMIFAIFVGIFLLWYARMLIRERARAKRKSRTRKSSSPSPSPSRSPRQKKADEE